VTSDPTVARPDCPPDFSGISCLEVSIASDPDGGWTDPLVWNDGMRNATGVAPGIEVHDGLVDVTWYEGTARTARPTCWAARPWTPGTRAASKHA
jgi:hypothetical protein